MYMFWTEVFRASRPGQLGLVEEMAIILNRVIYVCVLSLLLLLPIMHTVSGVIYKCT
jgi:hypothetical protein